jgi:hypothetical protein
MSATPAEDTPPTPEEMAAQFPIRPEEAQAIADAMTPLQDLTGVGDSFGGALQNVPGPGPKLVGSVLKNISIQVNLASQSAEAVAHAIDFYVQSQAGALEDLFPPPDVMAQQFEGDVESFGTAFRRE